jgi:hypothetical protein
VIDINAVLDELVGDLLVGDDDLRFGVVAGAEDGPVECGSAVLVCRFHVCAVCDQLFGFGEPVEDWLLFGFASGLVELLDEWRGVRDIEGDGGGVQFVVWRLLSVGGGIRGISLGGGLLIRGSRRCRFGLSDRFFTDRRR